MFPCENHFVIVVLKFFEDWFHTMMHQHMLGPSTSLGGTNNSALQSSVLSEGKFFKGLKSMLINFYDYVITVIALD